MTTHNRAKWELRGLTMVPVLLGLLVALTGTGFVLALTARGAEPVGEMLTAAGEAAQKGIAMNDAAYIFLSCFLFTLAAFLFYCIASMRIILRLVTRPCIASYLSHQEDDRISKENHR
jgi:hypothetical protein